MRRLLFPFLLLGFLSPPMMGRDVQSQQYAWFTRQCEVGCPCCHGDPQQRHMWLGRVKHNQHTLPLPAHLAPFLGETDTFLLRWFPSFLLSSWTPASRSAALFARAIAATAARVAVALRFTTAALTIAGVGVLSRSSTPVSVSLLLPASRSRALGGARHLSFICKIERLF